MPQPLMLNAFDPTKSKSLSPAVAQLLERRAKVLGPSYKLFYEEPLNLVRAEGVWMYDADDHAYLDVYNNVPSVGHCHPHVVGAMARQAATLNTHTRYLHDLVLTYAEKLTATFPEPLTNVMFTCTGSESADLALRIASHYTGGTGVIVTETAYHGITSRVSEISPSLGAGVPLGIAVRTVPAPDASLLGGEAVGARFAEHVERAARDLERHGFRVAALITDTIFSSDGVFADPAGFLGPAVETIHRYGGVFIADEVQPGFARTGEKMWGFERHDLVPDIVIMGKPMGNGIPIAGVVSSPEVLADFSRHARYFNTFGGNPVSCAAALAVLEVIEREKLQENAATVGRYLKSQLHAMAQDAPWIGQVRGAGLFLGVDVVSPLDGSAADPAAATRIVNGLRERRVLVGASGPRGHVLKIRPPLPFSLQNADHFLDALRQTSESLQ